MFLFHHLILVNNIIFCNVYHLLLNIIMLILLHLSALNFILWLPASIEWGRQLTFPPSPSNICWLCYFCIIRAQNIYISSVALILIFVLVLVEIDSWNYSVLTLRLLFVGWSSSSTSLLRKRSWEQYSLSYHTLKTVFIRKRQLGWM